MVRFYCGTNQFCSAPCRSSETMSTYRCVNTYWCVSVTCVRVKTQNFLKGESFFVIIIEFFCWFFPMEGQISYGRKIGALGKLCIRWHN